MSKAQVGRAPLQPSSDRKPPPQSRSSSRALHGPRKAVVPHFSLQWLSLGPMEARRRRCRQGYGRGFSCRSPLTGRAGGKPDGTMTAARIASRESMRVPRGKSHQACIWLFWTLALAGLQRLLVIACLGRSKRRGSIRDKKTPAAPPDPFLSRQETFRTIQNYRLCHTCFFSFLLFTVPNTPAFVRIVALLLLLPDPQEPPVCPPQGGVRNSRICVSQGVSVSGRLWYTYIHT